MVVLKESSPSLLLSNLSVEYGVAAFCDGDGVWLVHLATGKQRRVACEWSVVFEAKLFASHDGLVLVAAHMEGVTMWTVVDGITSVRPLRTHSFPSRASKEERGYARGIARSREHVCIGASTGDILVVRLDDGEKVTVESRAHSAPVTALGSCEDRVASGDERGEIRLREAPSMRSRTELDVGRTDEPVTCIAMPHRSACVAGFLAGWVRVYDECGLVAELQAHSRCVTALAICDDRLVTVGEDTYLHVWSLPSIRDAKEESTPTLFEPLYHHQVENAILTGLAIENKKIVAAAYEMAKLYTFN